MGLFTQCASPSELRGLNVAEVQKHEFACSGKEEERLGLVFIYLFIPCFFVCVCVSVHFTLALT